MENFSLNKQKMDVGIVRDFLDKIKMYAEVGNGKTAHSIEDTLFKAVIMAIKQEDCANVLTCCELCMSSLEIPFERLCA